MNSARKTVEKGAEPEKHCHYDIIYPEVGLKEDKTIETSRIVRIIENYRAKWERSAQAGQPEHNEDMCVMMSIIQEISNCLVFGFNEVKQAWETPHLLGRIYEAKLQSLAEKHEVLVDRFEEGKLLDALQEGMSNSSGRRAVGSIFAVELLLEKMTDREQMFILLGHHCLLNMNLFLWYI